MTQSKSNGNRHGVTDEKVVISTDPISPNSKKTYVAGTLHPEIQVPFREITLSSTVGGNGNGTHSENDESSILVYDTSGPYTDPKANIAVSGVSYLLKAYDSDEMKNCPLPNSHV